MAGFEIEGKLVKAYDMEVKGTSSFRTREFVIETMETYPQFVKFQSVQDKCDLLNQFQEGEIIKVSFDLRGRQWQDKYFTNLNAWRIEKSSNTSSPSAAPSGNASGSFDNTPSSFPTSTSSGLTSGEAEDLPF
jgi:single-strand DNA-binding protein